jgi:hypothetical protein
MELQYVYLIQEREFIHLEKPVFKIGKTKQINFTRFSQYPKGTNLIYQSVCSNCDICEKDIITLFKQKYSQRKDIGREYFEGNYINMVCDISEICINLWKKHQENIESDFRKIEENEIRQKIENEIRQKIENEIRQKIENENRQKIDDENRQKIDDENRQKIDDENRQKIGEAIREEIQETQKEIIRKVIAQDIRQELLDRRKFNCDICKFSTSSNFNLDIHLKTKKHKDKYESPEKTTNFQCNKCNKFFKGNSGLWAHKNINVGCKQF